MSSSRTTASGPYLICIDNLPKSYTWQDLKDLIRRQAKHSPSWTDVKVSARGEEGGKGCVKIQRQNEAWGIYQWLLKNGLEGNRVTVHLFDISESRGASLIDCNCRVKHNGPVQQRDLSGLASDQKSWQNVTQYQATSQPRVAYIPVDGNLIPVAITAAAPYPAVPVTQFPVQPNTQNDLARSMADMTLQVDPRLAALQQQAAAREMAQQMLQREQQRAMMLQRQQQQQQQPRQQQYTKASNGTLVNTQNGVVKTEQRGVFVSKISFKARSKDIERHFSHAGKIVRCDLQTDSRTGKSKGNATIQYATTDEAARAIDMFNGKVWQGMKLEVRGDRETTVLPTSSSGLSRSNGEPVIVNGSTSSPNSD